MNSDKGKESSKRENNSESGVEKFSKSDMERTKYVFNEFEYLNMFSKYNLSNMSEKNIRTIHEKYIQKMIPKSSTTPFLTRMKNEHRYVAMFEEENGYKKVCEELIEIQRSLLKSISVVRNLCEDHQSGVILSFKGKVHAYFDRKTNKYEIEYLPEGYTENEILDLEMECKMITARYFEVITYLLQEIPGERFELCKKCQTPFFAQTVKKRMYCSIKCARAVAQANWRKKEKGGDAMIKE